MTATRADGDPAWLPLFPAGDPPYPDYTSGANSLTGAVTRSLENFFGDDVWTFQAITTATENGQPIAPRTYHRFSALADDTVDGRKLLGIHFRAADEVARRQAKQSADQVFAHAFQPLDWRSPPAGVVSLLYSPQEAHRSSSRSATSASQFCTTTNDGWAPSSRFLIIRKRLPSGATS